MTKVKKFYVESELVFKEKPIDTRFQSLEGKRFGRLAVLGYAGDKNWFCKCECGKIVRTYAGNLKNGHTASCGCLSIEKVTTHGYTANGKKLPVYRSWCHMIDRCQNREHSDYHNYGGRGITVCDRWLKFENFLEDMGEMPPGLTLDRIENDKGYYKENCRWATMKEQGNNRRSNRVLTFNGKTQTVTQWAEETGINIQTLSARVNRYGWTTEKALTTK